LDGEPNKQRAENNERYNALNAQNDRERRQLLVFIGNHFLYL
jgi:hypothetical protein